MLTDSQIDALRLLEHISFHSFRFVYLSNHDHAIIRMAIWFYWFGERLPQSATTVKGIKSAMHDALAPAGTSPRERNQNFARLASAAILEATERQFAECWLRANTEVAASGESPLTFGEACERWKQECSLTRIVRSMGLTLEQEHAFRRGCEAAEARDTPTNIAP